MAKLLPDDKAVIVAHDWLELGMVSNLGLQNPVVQIVHGDYDYYYELAKIHASSIDTFITVAASIANKLKILIPDRAEDIAYLRFPVPEKKGPIEKHDGFSIIFIGRCTREKGYNVLPEIAKALIEGGQKVSWHIVGEIDEKTKTQYLWPDGANVRFYGSVPDKKSCRTISFKRKCKGLRKYKL